MGYIKYNEKEINLGDLKEILVSPKEIQGSFFYDESETHQIGGDIIVLGEKIWLTFNTEWWHSYEGAPGMQHMSMTWKEDIKIEELGSFLEKHPEYSFSFREEAFSDEFYQRIK